MANVAVVGAGPAGLAATRRLLEAGLNVTVFERKSQCGGTWYGHISNFYLLYGFRVHCVSKRSKRIS